MDLNTAEARSGLAKVITNLFDLWDLNAKEQLQLLGLSPNSRSSLKGYRQGKPLPNRPDLLERIGHLLRIHKSLGLLFPHNADIKVSWIRKRNKAFDNSTPLDLMLSEGLIGLAKVSRFLDQTTMC
jgi:hypothetical protein